MQSGPVAGFLTGTVPAPSSFAWPTAAAALWQRFDLPALIVPEPADSGPHLDPNWSPPLLNLGTVSTHAPIRPEPTPNYD